MGQESQERQGTQGSEPWWRNGKTITALAALFAAIVPITTVLEGFVEKQRSGTLEALKYAEAAREAYLDRISKTSNAERLAVLRFVLATSADPKLLEWAQAERTLVEADAKAKAQTAQLQAALDTAASDGGKSQEAISAIQTTLASARSEARTKRENLRLPASANMAAQAGAPRPATIVWIDPSPSNNLALKDVLEAYGWIVIPVGSIGEAERVLKSSSAALIISYDLIDSLNDSLKSRIPFIVYTPNKTIRDEAAKHGAFGSASRPSELLQLVTTALPPRTAPAAAD